MKFVNVTAQSATLANTLWPAGNPAAPMRLLRHASLVVAGALALTLSARAEVPLPLVPITLQTLVVLLLGAALGARLAASSVALYLIEGLFNLPVFAGTPEKGLGLSYMMGPTGGYLAGFLLAAALVGFCVERGWGRSLGALLVVMSFGHLVIFTFGYLWLAHFVGMQKAFAFGVAPFYAATILKTLLGAGIVSGSWKLIGRLRA
ncbi:MAG: biotin transporter BioY [Hyphomicrobiales bacterium]|nr:biotin transporter BioY [Hyphomicrobiales bacterium]MDE2114005.1 biotin transporter BioY [Hyphomicrobiales bacterium]